MLCNLVSQFCVLFEGVTKLVLEIFAFRGLFLIHLFELEATFFDEVDDWDILLHFLFDIRECFLELCFLVACVLQLLPQLRNDILVFCLGAMLDLFHSIPGLCQLCLKLYFLLLLLLQVTQQPIEFIS